MYVFTHRWIADIAFVDRADIKAYVGPPTLQARYEILRSCLQELMRKAILSSFQVQIILSHLIRGTISFSTFNIVFSSPNVDVDMLAYKYRD